MNDIDKLKANWEAEDKAYVDQAYRALLATQPGRRFISYLLEISKFMQQPFTGQALTTAFACGEQNVGKRILADMLEVDPEAFVTLMRERSDVHSRRQQQQFNAQSDSADAGAHGYFDYDRAVRGDDE